MKFRGLAVCLIFGQFIFLSKEEFFFCFGQKYNSSLSLVLPNFEAGCILEPLIGNHYLCLQGNFEDFLLFPDLSQFQKTPHDLHGSDFEYKVHELFLVYCQDAILL